MQQRNLQALRLSNKPKKSLWPLRPSVLSGELRDMQKQLKTEAVRSARGDRPDGACGRRPLHEDHFDVKQDFELSEKEGQIINNILLKNK